MDIYFISNAALTEVSLKYQSTEVDSKFSFTKPLLLEAIYKDQEVNGSKIKKFIGIHIIQVADRLREYLVNIENIAEVEFASDQIDQFLFQNGPYYPRVADENGITRQLLLNSRIFEDEVFKEKLINIINDEDDEYFLEVSTFDRWQEDGEDYYGFSTSDSSRKVPKVVDIVAAESEEIV
jgi:hypothetical protein